MKFADLRRMPLGSFIDKSRQPSGFWFFLHVPKTAGSSFATELRSCLSPYRNIYADPSKSGVTYSDRLRQSFDDFISLPHRQRFRSASGHVRFDLAKRLRDSVPNTRFLTILRSPEDRVISGYRYQRSEIHGPHERFRRDFPTLESWVEHHRSQNKMSRYIGGRGVGREELLQRIDTEFAFVGLLEMYDMSFNVAFDIMGFPGKLPSRHRRKTPETEDTSVEITPAVLKRIREVNALDFELYDHVCETLLPHQAEWEARTAQLRSARELADA